MKPWRSLSIAVLALACTTVVAAPSRRNDTAATEQAAKAKYEAAREADAKAKAEAAAGKANAESQLHDLRAQLDALAQQQHEAEGERSDASKALRTADGSVGAVTRALHDTESAIAAQQEQLAGLESQQEALAKKLSGQRTQLAALVRSAYALGGDEQLKLLLAQDRVVDLARALQYHRYLEADRLRRIRALTGQLRALADLSKQVDAQRATLAASRQEQGAKLAAVQSQRAQRGKLVATIDAGYHDRAARMQALGRDADSLENLVNKLTVVMARAPPPPPPPVHIVPAPPHHPSANLAVVTPGHPQPPVAVPFTGAPGHFAWPIAGRVLAGFGEGNSGLLIAGAAGEEVHAVADGRVAFANWLKGYGLLVIVDHGHGVMSLYANNDALLKNAGDTVQAGDALATVGSSGGQGRNALYFEIRQNGKAVDPRGWLRPH